MAPKPRKKSAAKLRYEYIHRLSAGVALLSFAVVLAGGLMSEARVLTIVYRAVGVIVLISVITKVVTQILATYEEIHSGKA